MPNIRYWIDSIRVVGYQPPEEGEVLPSVDDWQVPSLPREIRDGLKRVDQDGDLRKLLTLNGLKVTDAALLLASHYLTRNKFGRYLKRINQVNPFLEKDRTNLKRFIALLPQVVPAIRRAKVHLLYWKILDRQDSNRYDHLRSVLSSLNLGELRAIKNDLDTFGKGVIYPRNRRENAVIREVIHQFCFLTHKRTGHWYRRSLPKLIGKIFDFCGIKMTARQIKIHVHHAPIVYRRISTRRIPE